MEGNLLVEDLVFFCPTDRSDIDNRLKPLLDAMQDATDKKYGFVIKNLYRNDNQIREIRRLRFGPCMKPGKVRLTISEMALELFDGNQS